MKNLFKSPVFNFGLILTFTTLALWLVLKDSYNEVVETLKHAKLIWFIISILISLLIQAIIGVILMTFARMNKKNYSFQSGFINALIASFFHGITPSASGGQFVQVYVFRKQGISITDSASILWMDFIIYQSSMVGVVLILLILRYQFFIAYHSNLLILVLIGFCINSTVIVGLWAIVRFPVVYTWLTTKGIHLAEILHLIKDKETIIHNLNEQLKRFDTETKRLQGHTLLIIKCVILNILRLILYYSIPFFCAKALGIDVQLNQLIDILALSSFVSMINAFIPIPGASGGTETTFVLLFGLLFDKVKTVGCMLLWRFATYYLVMIIGGISFALFKMIVKRKELKGECL